VTAINVLKKDKKDSIDAQPQKESCTFICSRDTIDGVYPSLMLAINARRIGMDSIIFYTFMGLNVIRKGGTKKCQFVPKGTMGAIPGMSVLATRMMSKQIDEAGIPTIDELMEIAQLEGVKLSACKMTLDMMKLKPSDLIDGVVVSTAAEYIKRARACTINMFI
jgi:peroxiredoxin family protein